MIIIGLCVSNGWLIMENQLALQLVQGGGRLSFGGNSYVHRLPTSSCTGMGGSLQLTRGRHKSRVSFTKSS